MAPNNTTAKMSVDFDLTDIEDIDAISDEFDADPSSDDDTFISNRNKKAMKKRSKGFTMKTTTNNNHETYVNGQLVEKFETITTKVETTSTPSEAFKETTQKSDDSEEEDLVVETKKNGNSKHHILALNGPTDHFHELEKKMNGPGWMITSSSATQSEDELGAFEKDEFTFKMCQIIRRSGRHHDKRKKHHHHHHHHQPKHEKVVRHSSEDTTTKTETSEIAPSDDSDSDGGNMLKYCNRAVPLAALNEDDL